MKLSFNFLLICLMSVAIFGCEQKEVPDRIIKIISIIQVTHEQPGGFLGGSSINEWSVRGTDVDTGKVFIFSTIDNSFANIQAGETVVVAYGHCGRHHYGYFLRTIK